MRAHSVIMSAVAVVLILSGCSVTAAQAPAERSTVVVTPGATSAAASLLLAINEQGDHVDRSMISSIVAESLIDQIGIDPLGTTLDQVAAMGPWQIVASDTSGGSKSADLLLRSSQGEYQRMHTSVNSENLIEILWFGYAVDRDSPRDSVEQIIETAERVPARSSILIGRLVDGECVTDLTAGTSDGESLPLASVSKLFVIGAVLAGIEEGTLQWNDRLSLTESTRSLPAGRLSSAPSGTSVSVLEASVRALKESDNTAVDLLMERLGRDAVLRVRDQMAGESNERYFFSTRQVFSMGWGPDRLPVGTTPRTLEASALSDTRSLPSPFEILESRWDDGIDWFATSYGVCRAAAWLTERVMYAPADLQAAASDQENTILHKNGGNPGVAASLRVERDPADGTVRIAVSQYAADRPSDVGDADGLFTLTDDLGDAWFRTE